LTAEDEFSLTDRVAIVTGGSSGIGAASVRRLAAAGARVVVGYNRGLDRAKKLLGELPGTGHCAMHLPLDDTAQISRVAAAVADQFGRADILVNSAGFTRMVPHADLEAFGGDGGLNAAYETVRRVLKFGPAIGATPAPASPSAERSLAP
jgi:3-oxoacyl-[acyl-carrier protein] reductase